MTDWESVVGQHLDFVWRTACRLVGDDADAWDCTQQAFLDAVRLERRQGVRNWRPLLQHLATARALDLLRSRCRERSRRDLSAEPAEAVGREPCPSQWSEANELAEGLRNAVGRLPRRQAEVFCLICFEQMTSEEVAERLGIRPTAVRMLLSRARKRLERLLQPFGPAAEPKERTR
ncbi:MAG TPA: sigma-70 family RNA polymerase sigma factor [Pirellulales bacterium]|nr:sigma-70 family RNA polymerase sigma factor [Pirellulales bacterium]